MDSCIRSIPKSLMRFQCEAYWLFSSAFTSLTNAIASALPSAVLPIGINMLRSTLAMSLIVCTICIGCFRIAIAAH